jgi:hypothetical protein
MKIDASSVQPVRVTVMVFCTAWLTTAGPGSSRCCRGSSGRSGITRLARKIKGCPGGVIRREQKLPFRLAGLPVTGVAPAHTEAYPPSLLDTQAACASI